MNCVQKWTYCDFLYRVVQKTDTLCFVQLFIRLNFIKYWPNFKLYCMNQKNICDNNVAKYPTTPQVCRYTTLWNVSVLKATTENKTSSVTTHFKKLTTGNNVLTVSLIIKNKYRILQFLHQMFNMSALLLDDELLKCVVTESVVFNCSF